MADELSPTLEGVKARGNVEFHLDVDPNDPRNAPEATVGFSLNEDDPEKAPAKQSYKDV